MTTISYAGDPEAVAAYLTTLIGSGNTIYMITKTKGNTKYLIMYGP
jgi:hypothetical protein